MRLFFTLFCLMTSVILWAQPIITADDVRPEIGDKFVGFFYSVDTDDYPAGSAGADVTWDFSGLRDSLPNDLQGFFDDLDENPLLIFEAVDPAGVLLSDSFPDADLAVFSEINFLGKLQSYFFLDENSAGFLELGDVSITSFDLFGMLIEDTTLTVNDPPTVFLPMPLTFGASVTSRTTFEEEDISGMLVTETTAFDSTVIDAYGTLITPWRTYSDVLRVTTHTTDTIVEKVKSSGMIIETSVETTLSYSWYAKGSLAPLLTYDLPDSDEEEGSLFAFVQSNFVVTSSRDKQLETVAARVYPNPATDQIRIDFNQEKASKNVSVSLYDMQGRLLQRTSPVHLSEGPHNIRLGFHHSLAAGTYVLEMRSNEFIAHRKIAVQ